MTASTDPLLNQCQKLEDLLALQAMGRKKSYSLDDYLAYCDIPREAYDLGVKMERARCEGFMAMVAYLMEHDCGDIEGPAGGVSDHQPGTDMRCRKCRALEAVEENEERGGIIKMPWLPPDPQAECRCGLGENGSGYRRDIVCPRHDGRSRVTIKVDSACNVPVVTLSHPACRTITLTATSCKDHCVTGPVGHAGPCSFPVIGKDAYLARHGYDRR
jgi:hypothetical protein